MHFTVEQYSDHVDNQLYVYYAAYVTVELGELGFSSKSERARKFGSYRSITLNHIQEYPKRKDKHKRGGQSSQAIRDRHLEVIRSNEQPVIEPTQIIVWCYFFVR